MNNTKILLSLASISPHVGIYTIYNIDRYKGILGHYNWLIFLGCITLPFLLTWLSLEVWGKCEHRYTTRETKKSFDMTIEYLSAGIIFLFIGFIMRNSIGYPLMIVSMFLYNYLCGITPFNFIIYLFGYKFYALDKKDILISKVNKMDRTIEVIQLEGTNIYKG